MSCPPPEIRCLRALLLVALALVGPPQVRAQGGIFELAGSHDGASDTIRLLYDQHGPQIHITSPAFGSVLAGNVVTLSGTVDDRFSENPEDVAPLFGVIEYRVFGDQGVEIDAGETFVVDGRFTIPDLVLGTGSHDFLLEAQDSAGIRGSAFHGIATDPSAPAVALVGPADGEAVIASTVALDLNFAAPVTLLSVNGNADGRSFPAGLAEDAVTVALALGANVVTLELDGGDGPTTASFTIFRVASAEPIRIVDPPEGTALNSALVPVTVRAARGTPFVRINGIDASAAADGVTFTAEVPIRAGENPIEAVVFPFGQTARIVVRGDFTPPRLLALLPPDGTITADGTLDVIGFVDEGASVDLLGPAGARTVATVLDHERSQPAFGVFVHRFEAPGLPLDPGVNTMEIRLRDAAGNETTETVAFEARSAALALVDPADGAALAGARASVELEALADLTIEAWFAAGREIPDLAGIALAPGVATFAGVPLVPGENEMRVVHRRPGGEPEVLSFRLVSTAPPLATVEGTVLDTRSGAPLAGALVEIAVNGITVVVTTDAAGRFGAEVEPGLATVSVRSEGFLVSTATATAVAAATTTIDLSLLPWTTAPGGLPGAGPGATTSRVEGIVSDAAFGAPLPGVTVAVQAGIVTLFATTDADGFYAVEAIPTEPFTVAFAAGGFIAQVFEIPFETPVDWRLDAALEALSVGGGAGTSRLFGRVFDEDTGAGLAGAAITVDRDGTILTGASGPDGTYAIEEIPAGPFHVSVALEGFVTRAFDVPFEDAGATQVDVGLVASGAGGGAEASVVRGTVQNAETGALLAGALVSVTAGGVTLAATTDAAGSVTIRGIPVAPLTITVTREGFLPRVFDVATDEPTVIPLVASLLPLGTEATLVGTVRSGISGQLEAGVTVRLLGTSRTATTDDTGQFTLATVPLGTDQTLVLAKPGFIEAFSTFSLAPDRAGNPVRIEFTYPILESYERSLAIDFDAGGTVVDALTGLPLEGAEIQAGTAATVTDADGRFRLTDLPPDTVVRVTATAPDHEPQGFDALVVPNGDSPLDFRLAPTLLGEVSGTVTDAGSGAAIAYAEVGIEGSTFLSTVTEADGSYRLLAVPAGTHTIVARSPEHFPEASAGFVVSADTTSAFDAALAARPRAGGLAGRVLDATTGDPIAGALLALADGRTVTSAADGSYAFLDVSAGLARVTIEAAGYAAASRVAPVDADVDDATPTITTFDFRLDGSGDLDASEASALIEASVGGSIETPDGRMRLDIPPGSLTGDGVVTIRKSPLPVSTPGASIASDPDLALPPVTALSEEVEILIGPPPGGEKPLLAGPVFVVARYFEEVATAVGASEASVFPYLHTGDAWTALRMVPYLHAVDRINNVVVAGLVFGETETGRGVVAEQTMRRPLLLAQAGGGGFQPIFLDAFRLVIGAVARVFAFNPAVELVEIKDLAAFADQRLEAPFFAVNTFSHPLLVVHGWDPLSILRDSQLIREPLEDVRYGQILRDLVAMTNAVYRPLWLTYNTRLGIVSNGQALAEALRSRYPDPPPDSLAFADPDRRPIDATQSPKLFQTFDSFGFSMGGLVARTYQLGSFFADPPAADAVGGGREGRLAHMVAMGTPHHGALQLLRIAVSGTASIVWQFPLEQLLSLWSPGTADLLDYVDRDDVPCFLSGNPSLCALNLDLRSAPIIETSLIAGTKSTQRLANALDLDLGLLVVPGMESDSVVPLSSAHGESTLGRRLVPALRKRKTFTEGFDHLHAGTDATAQGEGDQRISLFADRDILSTLRDHWVIRERGLVADEPIFGPGVVVERCPTLTQPGRIKADISFDWKAMNGGVTGIAIVTYAQDASGEWRILHGADPETGELDSLSLLATLNNSKTVVNPEDRRIQFDDSLRSAIDPRRTLSLFLITGRLSPSGGKAPLRPSDRDIARAENVGRIQACP
ncbi:carboxypeptidase regulatory-like domain-containing protein [Myxococcota bacterium]|nr:carboxypeptidase regulatory-like domain-containing protein [Myxococcota bacterium]